MTRTQTELIRRFIAEHAWRMVFAAEPDDEVQKLRPRTVNHEEFQREREQWAAWHDQQTAAEREMEMTNTYETISPER